MASHTILENDDFKIIYIPEDKVYVVDVFKDGHYWDTCKFTALVDNLEPGGNKFGSAVLDYKRCPMCGAHMLTIE